MTSARSREADCPRAADQVAAAQREPPGVAPVGVAAVAELPGGLAAVMSPAQRRQVLGIRLAGWTAVVGVSVGLEMVEVAGPGVGLAPGKDTVTVAQDHLLAHPLVGVVAVQGPAGAEVEHGDDRGPAALEPVADLGQGHRAEALGRAEGAGSV